MNLRRNGPPNARPTARAFAGNGRIDFGSGLEIRSFGDHALRFSRMSTMATMDGPSQHGPMWVRDEPSACTVLDFRERIGPAPFLKRLRFRVSNGRQDLQRREILRILSMAASRHTFQDSRNGRLPAPTTGRPVPRRSSQRSTRHSSHAEEYKLVERLAELIIPSDGTPGAREAGVAEFVDFMVAHEREKQYKFRTGMTWLNATRSACWVIRL